MSAPTSGYPVVPLLPYAQVRPLLHSGDILLCSGTSIFARLIQHATESVWSHVGFIMWLEAIDRVMVLESVESIGVRTVPLNQYISNYNNSKIGYQGRVFVARHAAWEAQAPDALTLFSQSAVDLFGSPYDTQEIVSIAARIVAAKLGMNPREVRNNRAYICSEYSALCYRSLGINIPFDPANFIAPKDFATAPDVSFLWEIEVDHAAC